MSSLETSVADNTLHGPPQTGCDRLPQSHSPLGSPSNDTFLDLGFILPMALVGLSHITDGTIYDDAIRYLVPPDMVESVVAHRRQDWKTMDFATLLEKIISLKDAAKLRGIIPDDASTEHDRYEALLRYLRRARDDQLKRCIYEHRQLRELENGVMELSRKLGKTYSTCDELVAEDDEDRITFIDDDSVHSCGEPSR